MKRKRGAATRKAKKPSEAADNNVDPGYYSDDRGNNDVLDSRVEQVKEVSTHTSGQHVGLDRLAVNYNTPGSAAAKLARAISTSHTISATDRVPLQRETIGKKEPKSSGRAHAPIYNKQELDAAQSVIRDIMKMDEAASFSVPVDPIALNIPDYFDIIERPMDFGTIYGNLDKGLEYINSEDVFKDVQQIWDNCCKYNKAGSYIVNLMNRVKTNFMKQWTAAGLYNGHLPNNPQLFAEPVRRHEEPMHMYPGGPMISSSAYSRLDPRQHHQYSPYYSHTFRPPPLSYQPPYYSLHPGQSPGQHQHDLAPQYNHYSHVHPVDLMNGNYHTPWINEATPGLMPSHQPSPSFSLMGQPQEKTYMHQPSSSQLPPPSAFSNHHALNSARNAGDGYHHQHQMDPVPPQNPHPSSSCIPAHDLNQTTSHHLHSSHTQKGKNIDHTENLPVLPPAESTLNYSRHGAGSLRHPLTDNTSYQKRNQIISSPERSSSTDNIGTCSPQRNMCKNQQESSPSKRIYSTAISTDNNFSKKKDQGQRITQYQEKSTVNCAKRGTGSIRNQLTEVSSSPEQSSSTENIETCHPLDTTSPNQCESSPPKRLYSTADNGFSKKKDQGEGLTQNQEKSSSVMNKQIQDEISSLQPLSLPLDLDDTTKLKKRKRGRGPTRSPELREGERIPVAIDDEGQPVGPTAHKLVNYCGILARNAEFLPLTYLNWRAVPLENKENMWQKIQSKFEIDPVTKDGLLQSIGLKWKSWKAHLKTAHYYPHETDAERLADRNERVPPDQWADLIAFWSTEPAKKISARNRANSSKQKFYHASGNKSFARIREERKSAGKELSRAELFIMTRTRKNGEPINMASAEVIKQLREREKAHDDTPQESNKEGDILTDILGPTKNGRSRCIELGPSPCDLLKPSRGEAIKMVAQAKVEIREMKDKMAIVEQTCAQMASQMAAMMSMMSSMQSRNSADKNANLPDKNAAAPHMDANPSVSSEHSTPRPIQVQTRPPCSYTGSTRVTRSKREF